MSKFTIFKISDNQQSIRRVKRDGAHVDFKNKSKGRKWVKSQPEPKSGRYVVRKITSITPQKRFDRITNKELKFIAREIGLEFESERPLKHEMITELVRQIGADVLEYHYHLYFSGTN